MTVAFPQPTRGPLVPAKDATVYIVAPIHPAALSHAKTKFKEVLTFADIDESEGLAKADGVILRTGTMDEKKLLISKRLLAISRCGAGYDSIHAPTATRLGIPVSILPGMNADAVAELTLTLALNLLRRVKELDARMTSGDHLMSIYCLGHSLKGKEVGLVGMGAIALATAKLFRAFGATLTVYSPTSPSARWTTPGDTFIPHTRKTTLQALLETADVVSLHCPLTDTTRGSFDNEAFARMKKSAILINTARGGIVDEGAMERALREGRIAGAGVDVWSKEPVQPEEYGSLILQNGLPNLICLPHIGASTEETAEQTCTEAVEILAAYLDSKGLANRVI